MKIIFVSLFLSVMFYSYANAGPVHLSDEARSYNASSSDEGISIDGKRATPEEAWKALNSQPHYHYRGPGSTKSTDLHFRGLTEAEIGAPPSNVPPIPENLDQYPVQAENARVYANSSKDIAIRIHFAFDDSHISSNDKLLLSRIIHGRSISPNSFLVVIGHSDSQGSSYYNMTLSERRAKSVSDYLKLINPSLQGHIRWMGMGEMEPVIKNGREDRAASRRVQLGLLSD